MCGFVCPLLFIVGGSGTPPHAADGWLHVTFVEKRGRIAKNRRRWGRGGGVSNAIILLMLFNGLTGWNTIHTVNFMARANRILLLLGAFVDFCTSSPCERKVHLLVWNMLVHKFGRSTPQSSVFFLECVLSLEAEIIPMSGKASW